jgi:MFS family permease
MRYTVLSFLCIITVIAYIQRSAFNGATETIESDLAISSSRIGFVMGGWYLAYALFQLPSGWVADRYGSKRALLLFATTWSVFTGMAGMALGLPGLLLIWGLMGAAQAGIFPCCTKAIGSTFPRTEQAFASGLLAACMSLGAALAPFITSQLLGSDFNITDEAITNLRRDGVSEVVLVKLFSLKNEVFSQNEFQNEIAKALDPEEWKKYEKAISNRAHVTLLTWRQIFAVYTLPGILWAIAFALLIPRPETLRPIGLEPSSADAIGDVVQSRRTSQVGGNRQWLKLITDKQMLILSIQQFFRAGPMAIFFTWFARVISETSGFSQAEAGRLSSLPPLLGIFGGVFGGFFSDWLLKKTGNARLARQGLTFTLLLIGTIVSLAAYFTDVPKQAVILMSVAGFCGMAGGVSGYSIAISYGGKRVASVFATMNMSGNLGATFFPIAAGWLADETKNWNYVILLFAAMFAIGAVCWTILNPKGTLFPESEEQK